MKENLSDILLNLCFVLESKKVEYIIVGGTAVALHGYFRHSVTLSGEITNKPDIDIWFNPTYKNYINLLNVLESFEINVFDLKNEININPKKSFFRIELTNFTLDLIPEIKAKIKFSDAFKRKQTLVARNITINYLGIDDLIKDKQFTARKKDIDDLNHLNNLRDKF